MKTILVGDIHIGKSFPYSNRVTAPRWAALQDDTIERILRLTEIHGIIQLGDLFDTPTVNCHDFVRGWEFAQKCEYVIAGNHDLSNNTERTSAIELLLKLGCHVVRDTLITNEFYIVPHHLLQKDFEESLESLGSAGLTLLHCNFGYFPGQPTENYLTTQMAQKLGKVISGHEHDYKQVGNVTMLGSILPMNFGEMTDKYIMVVNEDQTEFELVCIWEKDRNYAKVSAREFLDIPLDAALQFIEIFGNVTPEENLLVSQRVIEWYTKNKTVIAIKNTICLQTSSASFDDTDDDSPVLLDWVEIVKQSMSEEQIAVLGEVL